MSGMNHYLCWRGPLMEWSLPVRLPIRTVKRDCGRWGKKKAKERKKTHNPIDFPPNTAVFYMCVSKKNDRKLGCFMACKLLLLKY